MPSLGASPLQNPDPIVHKVSNGHTVHFCESAAEENKNYLKKYLPVSRAVLHLLTLRASASSVWYKHAQCSNASVISFL